MINRNKFGIVVNMVIINMTIWDVMGTLVITNKKVGD